MSYIELIEVKFHCLFIGLLFLHAASFCVLYAISAIFTSIFTFFSSTLALAKSSSFYLVTFSAPTISTNTSIFHFFWLSFGILVTVLEVPRQAAIFPVDFDILDCDLPDTAAELLLP